MISEAIVVQRVEANGPGVLTVTAAFTGNGKGMVTSMSEIELNNRDDAVMSFECAQGTSTRMPSNPEKPPPLRMSMVSTPFASMTATRRAS